MVTKKTFLINKPQTLQCNLHTKKVKNTYEHWLSMHSKFSAELHSIELEHDSSWDLTLAKENYSLKKI
jgi:hypothetical protein